MAESIISDVSKMMYFFSSKDINWDGFLEPRNIANYPSVVKKNGVGCEGQLTKLERVGDALKYMRVCLPPSDIPRHTQLSKVESLLNGWKVGLRKEKKKRDVLRLEDFSNSKFSLTDIKKVIDNEECGTFSMAPSHRSRKETK